MKPVSEGVVLGETQSKVISMSEESFEYKNMGPLYAGWARILSFTFGVVLSVFILILPQVVAKDVSELDHRILSLIMLAMSGCFVHGVGFVPKNILAKYLFSPYVCWPIVGLAVFQWFL